MDNNLNNLNSINNSNHNNNDNTNTSNDGVMKLNTTTPMVMDSNVNLSDPEELEAHMQVMDVRERLRQRRRKMIRIFTIGFLLIES